MGKTTLWLRDEARVTERRTALLPTGAKELLSSGFNVIVEKSEKRIFSNEAYAEAGCTMVEAGTWENAPEEAIILGLKELPEMPETLKHAHIYFAHAYKEQSGWQELLTRFQNGGGTLLDIEYMTDRRGKRVVAFGYWAGYMGAALALLQWYDRAVTRPSFVNGGLHPFESAEALDTLIKSKKVAGTSPKALIIGAGGRSGRGAAEIFERHGIEVTRWGRSETADLDRQAILDHDILVNCSFVADTIPPFLTADHLKAGQKLAVISDVSCDPFSDFNPLPLYSAPTCWKKPAIAVGGDTCDLDLIAVDNLPSLLPTEASVEFSGLLLPYLKTLRDRSDDPVWQACEGCYHHACKSMSGSKVA